MKLNLSFCIVEQVIYESLLLIVFLHMYVYVFRSGMYLCRVRHMTPQPKMLCCCGASEWLMAMRTSVCATSPHHGETAKHSLQSCIDTGLIVTHSYVLCFLDILEVNLLPSVL